MAHYDKATSDFITKIAGSVPDTVADAPDEEHLSLDPLRAAKRLTKGVKNPREALAKYLVSTATKSLMEKDSSIKILKLYGFMNDHYDREWWDWEPETIWKSLETDHLDGEGSTPDELKNAVMALQLCVNSMAPFEHWHIFEKVGHAFSWNPVNFEIVQPLEPDEAALAMQLMRRIQPKSIFDDEVLSYVAVCAKSAGMVWLPDSMAPGVQDKLDGITYELALRDAAKKAWEEKALPGDDLLKSQVEIQLARLRDVAELLGKESVGA